MSSRRVSRKEFENYVDEALGGLPAQFRKYLENIVIAVEEEPLQEDYEECDVPDEDELLGVFRGVPFFERGQTVSHLPAQIAIFRGPILRCCETRGEAVREIRETVVHEIGHMLGLDEEELP